MSTTGAGAGRPYRGIGSGQRTRTARIVGFLFTGVWLLYLVSGVVSLYTHPYGAAYRAGGVAIIVAFSAVYLALVPNWPVQSGRYRLPGLALLALLAVAGCLFYGRVGLVGLWIFLSPAVGLLVEEPRRAVRAVIATIAGYVLFSFTTHSSSATFLSNLLPVTFLGLTMIGLRSRFRLAAELARAREEVAQLAASEERLRLARDMHDLTGQSLSVITLKSELAARLLGRLPGGPDRDRARDEVEQVAAVSRQTLRDIREAISGYRRPTLAVEVITARAALASAAITVHDDPELTLLSGTFDPEAEAALAWCLREAVTNVVRHSGARACWITLSRRSETMALTVRDDGSGLACRDGAGKHEPDAAAPEEGLHGSGLHGMSERLSAVGGALDLHPDLQPGFRLTASVPLSPREPAAGLSATGTVPGR